MSQISVRKVSQPRFTIKLQEEASRMLRELPDMFTAVQEVADTLKARTDMTEEDILRCTDVVKTFDDSMIAFKKVLATIVSVEQTFSSVDKA